MKMWLENKVDKVWELSNEEIAKRFLKSEFVWMLKEYGTARALVDFISLKEGLNSSWDWDHRKGSIEGSQDILEILEIIKRMEAKNEKKG